MAAPPISRHGARLGTTYGPDFWAAVYGLYEEAFPGLPARIELARRAGIHWEALTFPFAHLEGDRCLAVVGVLEHPLILGGEHVRVAGIHAVCTAAARRRQGLCRSLLREALAWADARYPLAKLHTDDPEVYAGQGFTVRPTFRFRSVRAPGPAPEARLLEPSRDAAHRALLAGLLARRSPPSRRLATADPGWLPTTVAALTGQLDQGLWYLPEHEAVVGLQEEGDEVLITEVIAESLPPAEALLGHAARGGRPVVWTFCPELLEPEAEPVPTPRSQGVLMTRGPWPEDAGPVGVSPLWEH